MNIKQCSTAVILAGALAGLTGCGSSGGGTGAESPSPEMVTGPESTSSTPAASSTAAKGGGEEEQSAKLVITVEDFKFDGPKTVPPGATVTVVNKDSAPHTVTSEEEGVFDVQFEGGETVTFTAPEEPGEYPYICSLHPAMTATLVVK